MSWDSGSCSIVFEISLNCHIQTDRETRWLNPKPVNMKTCMVSTSVQRKEGEAGGHLMDLRAGESQTVNICSLESMAG